MQKQTLVIGGPTGVGENTITNKLVDKYPSVFTRLVTATTRDMRNGEEDKITYYFFTQERFEQEMENGNILEWTNVRDKNIYYGTYAPDLYGKFEKGFVVIINPDLVGARYFKENFDATTIFLLPESMDRLRQQHLDRDSDVDGDELEKRLQYAQYEIDNEAEFYDYQVVNEYGKIDDTIEKIVEILKVEGYPVQ